MLIPDRRRLLLEHLTSSGSAEVGHLAEVLRVSPSTVRRDLTELESAGRLRRTQGGAYVDHHRPSAPPGLPGDEAAKRRIGAAAAAHVTEGSTVMIVPGSTTSAMVPHLAGRSITVVTNGLDIAHALAASPSISLVVLGGVLHRDQMSLLGSMTQQNMADFHVDVMFAGAFGVHPRTGVTGSKPVAASYHHSMLDYTDELVVLADAMKIGRNGPTRMAGIDQLSRLITDSGAAPAIVAELRAGGVTVEIC